MSISMELHIEVKINDKWEHYSNPPVRQDLNLFNEMGYPMEHGYGKRKVLSDALPDDLSYITKISIERMHGSIYFRGWLNFDKIIALDRWVDEFYNEFSGLESYILNGTYFFGGRFAGFKKYKEDNQWLYDLGVQDIRFIYWFM